MNSDLTGKEKLKEFVEKRGKANIKFTTDDKDRIDAIVGNATVEIKYRKGYNFNSPLIQKGGILLEKEKVDYGVRTILESGYTNSYYCSIFSDDIITFIDFVEVANNLKPLKRQLPKTSEFKNNKRVDKEVYLVPIDMVKTYKL